MKSRLLGAFSAGIFLLGLVSTADAALVGRLPATPGGTNYQAYYDTVLNITWDANANRGAYNWNAGTAWAANFTLGGITGWRLPSMDKNGDRVVLACTTANAVAWAADNEFGYLWAINGITTTSPGPFSGVPTVGYSYWASSAYSGDRYSNIRLDTGGQHGSTVDRNLRVWAVKDGDVFASTVVPIPAAIWLFGSGLLGLIGMAKRKKA